MHHDVGHREMKSKWADLEYRPEKKETKEKKRRISKDKCS